MSHLKVIQTILPRVKKQRVLKLILLFIHKFNYWLEKYKNEIWANIAEDFSVWYDFNRRAAQIEKFAKTKFV